MLQLGETNPNESLIQGQRRIDQMIGYQQGKGYHLLSWLSDR
jgi:hypothetical protein